LNELCIRGTVFSGKGEAAKFVKLPWAKRQLEEKLGFDPYPGTLNLKLDKESVKLKNRLSKEESIDISSAPGYCHGRCFKAVLMNNLEGAVVIPETVDYPRDIVEVVAPMNLREKLRLKDGDVVDVKIFF
jgi:riboflavin kinase